MKILYQLNKITGDKAMDQFSISSIPRFSTKKTFIIYGGFILPDKVSIDCLT